MAILQGFAKHLRERRRERGRAAPTRDQIACYGQPYASLFIGGEGAAPPSRVSHPQGVRPALDGKGEAAKGGEEREAHQYGP